MRLDGAKSATALVAWAYPPRHLGCTLCCNTSSVTCFSLIERLRALLRCTKIIQLALTEFATVLINMTGCRQRVTSMLVSYCRYRNWMIFMMLAAMFTGLFVPYVVAFDVQLGLQCAPVFVVHILIVMSAVLCTCAHHAAASEPVCAV